MSAAAILAVLVAAGCEPKPPPEAAKRSVVRPLIGLAIDVPQGWTYRELGGDVVLEIYKAAPAQAAAPTSSAAGPQTPANPAGKAAAPESPGNGSGAVVHVVVIDRDRAGLKEWADQAIKDSQEIQPDLAVTAREETKLADGREALRITLRSERALEPLVQEMLLVQASSRAYALIATGPAGDMAAAQGAVKTCFDSLVVW